MPRPRRATKPGRRGKGSREHDEDGIIPCRGRSPRAILDILLQIFISDKMIERNRSVRHMAIRALLTFLLVASYSGAIAQNKPSNFQVSEKITDHWTFVTSPLHPGCEFLSLTIYTGVLTINVPSMNSAATLIRSGKDGIACGSKSHARPQPLSESYIRTFPNINVHVLLESVKVISPTIILIGSGDRQCLLQTQGPIITQVYGTDIRSLQTKKRRCF